VSGLLGHLADDALERAGQLAPLHLEVLEPEDAQAHGRVQGLLDPAGELVDVDASP
jgi:hypothetical protein